MFESIIMMLIWLCLFAIVVYIVLFVLGEVGIALPPKIVRLFWVIVALIVVLFMFRILSPSLHFPTMHGITACEGYSNCEVETK